MKQESCRKNVECVFVVLQSHFAIIVRPSRFWRKDLLHEIMTTCIILHNIIIDNDRDFNAPIQDVVEASTLQ
ncbi:hypothetical protein EJD97_023738 [Solanum chilense]|uniref:DDE Tnp4 domain-containing protein n=1 Tax=Solanum chilense TaxID=4083 RepID=A0A6N2AFL5_SOLCI|nr:hypothetical protein EJD97_023738 [Solanum chilense]